MLLFIGAQDKQVLGFTGPSDVSLNTLKGLDSPGL